MKTSAKYYWLLAVCCAMFFNKTTAQSYTEIKGNFTVFAGSGATEMSRMLYIGPNAVINVIGEWRIASEQVYISPTATINGTGSMVFDAPANYTLGSTPLSWGKQTVDGGGVHIGCNVLIRNNAGVTLNNITVPAVLGYANDNVAELDIANRLTFSANAISGIPVTGNNLILNTYDVLFTGSATVNNFTPDHFIVTNSTGNCSKDSLGASGFTFPVGIDSGDYTPAQMTNNGVIDRYAVRAMVNIQPAYNLPQFGIDRTWNIAESVPGGSDVTLMLQHNYTDGFGGPGTSAPNYNDAAAYVSTSLPTSATWDFYPVSSGIAPGTLASGLSVSNSTMLGRTGLNDFTTSTRFTKFSMLPQNGIHAVKTAVPDSVQLGDNFNYHFVLTNNNYTTINGPVTLTDTLPIGAVYVSGSGNGWAFTDNDKIVTAVYAGNIAPGDSIVMDITVLAFKIPLANVAFVTADTIQTPTAPCDTCTPGDPTTPYVILPPLHIPDAFSPNGDGINDFFVIQYVDILYPEASLDIYNRWGDEVWNSKGAYKNDFDGKNYGGTVLPDGTYFYVFKYNDGSKREVSHFINISRQ